jgi:hypothetical protein
MAEAKAFILENAAEITVFLFCHVSGNFGDLSDLDSSIVIHRNFLSGVARHSQSQEFLWSYRRLRESEG